MPGCRPSGRHPPHDTIPSGSLSPGSMTRTHPHHAAAAASRHLPARVAILLAYAAAGCGHARGEDAAQQGGTLAARCETAVERAAAAPPRASAWHFVADLPIGD